MKLYIFQFKTQKNDYYKFICILDYSNNINNSLFTNESLTDKLINAAFYNQISIKQFILEHTNLETNNEPNHEYILNNYNNMYTKDNRYYYFDIQYGLFDNLRKDAIKFLDNLLNIIKKNEKKEYINQKFWKKYNPFHLQLTNNNRKLINFFDKNINNTKSDFEFISSMENLNMYAEDIVLPLENEDNSSRIKNKFYEFIGYVLTPKDEMDMIICFLDALFSFNIPIILKKCEDCGKYFICRSGNTHKCNRIGEDNLSCSKRAGKIRRQHERNIPIKKLEKKVRDHLRYNEIAYQKFCDENYKKKKELFRKDKEYIEWLLGYFDKNKQQDIINKINGLKDYLN